MTSTVRPRALLRFIAAGGRGLRRLGVGARRIDADRLVTKARRSTGLHDFGGADYREPLERLVESANESTTITPLGRLFLTHTLVDRLSNRLHTEEAIRREPTIVERSIEAPIFIVAQPRTGTTLLHRLLAQNPACRVPLQWEMDVPCPPPEPATHRTDPRIRQVGRQIALLDWLCPPFKSIHEVGADLPEECINLFANDISSVLYLVGYDLPGYAEWLYDADLRPLYRRHARQLQLLQARFPERRWVLKAPMHLLGLEALLDVYPDATVVQTHRDPREVIASETSLFFTMRQTFHDPVDPAAVGTEILDQLAGWGARAMAARATAEADPNRDVRFIDLSYRDVVADPVARARALSEELGLPVDASTESRMAEHLTRNRQHKHGRHRYRAEDFGLDEPRVTGAFGDYLDRFGALL